MKLDAFIRLRRVTDVVPHPSGRYAIATVSCLSADGAKRISELWRVSLEEEGDGEEPTCIVSGEVSCHSPTFDGEERLYFLSARKTKEDDAKEVDQVWRFDGDDVSQVTDEALGVLDYRVAGEHLVVLAPVLLETPGHEQRVTHREQCKNGPSGRLFRDMNVRSWDRWVGGPAPHLISYTLGQGRAEKRQDLCPDFDQQLAAEHGLAWDLSADGALVTAVCVRTGTERLDDSSVLIINVCSGEHSHVGLVDRMTHQGVLFSPGSSQVTAARHIRKSKEHGAMQIVRYDCSDGSAFELGDGWDSVPTLCGSHGDSLIVTASGGGCQSIYEISPKGVTQKLAEDVGGSYDHVSCAKEMLVGLHHTFRRAPEVFCMPVERGATPRLCSAISMQGDPESFSVESCYQPGAGGTPIHYYILSSDATGPRPTVLWIHGGPVSAWSDGWHWRWNPLPLLAAGYNVALPNPRGSTGYGQDFIEGIVNNEWGAACFEDLMAVTDALCDRSNVDDGKLIAMGGSFGGYMSNWIATQTDRFAAIVTHASLYRLSAFHGTTDWPAYWVHHMGLHPSENPVLFDRYSPHALVEQWKTPVLITHGEKDYRVPISEALMLFEDVRRLDVDASLLVFPDENHWILKPRNAELWYQSCLDFMDRHTGNG